MKKLLLLIVLPMLYSCGSSIMEVASSGKPYEIFVVTSKPVWTSAVGDSIRTTFAQEVEWINQPEPIFDLYNITPEGLNDHIRKHRNLFFVTVDAAADSCSFSARQDVWATNQEVINFTGPSVESMAAYWANNSAIIVQWLSNIERDRMAARAVKYNTKFIDNLVAEKFGLAINIPVGYKVNADKPDFLWIGSDIKLGTLGIVFYTFKRDGDKPLDLLSRRNYAVAQVPGPSDGSYMITDTTFFLPEASGFELAGQQWMEIRGFWKIENDFMGGPFISYIAFDKERQQYIGIDMFINSPSPKYPKRNYIRQFESIIMNAHFISSSAPQTAAK